jgi:hypothetical protein
MSTNMNGNNNNISEKNERLTLPPIHRSKNTPPQQQNSNDDSYILDEKARYAKLQEKLRPSQSLLTSMVHKNDPFRSPLHSVSYPHSKEDNKDLVTPVSTWKWYDSGSIDSTDSISSELNPPRLSNPTDLSSSSSPSVIDPANDDPNLVFTSNLNLPTIVIPESRIKTPRTPQMDLKTPRRTKSPSDEMFLTTDNYSPSQFLINRKYKSTTPTASPFKPMMMRTTIPLENITEI